MSSSPSFIFSPLQDQHFGMCITPQDLILPFYNIQRRNYYRPWKCCTQNNCKNIGSTIVDDKENFKIILDVEDFRENEIDVRVTESEIIIIAEHEERQDEHSLVARKFKRRYIVPRDCLLNNVTCTLSADGILTVIAAKKSLQNIKDKERNVLIKLSDAYREQKDINLDDDTTGTEIEQYSAKKEIEDNLNKEKQIMLKEDNSSCLLKTEFLGDANSAFLEVSNINAIEKLHSDFDAEVDGLMNMRCEIEQAKKIVSEFLEESLGISDTLTSQQLEAKDSNLQQFQSNDVSILETFDSATTEELSSTNIDAAVSEIAKANMTNVISSEVESEVSNITENTDINSMKEMEQYSTATLEKCKQDISTECLKQSNTAMSTTLSMSESTEQSSTSTVEQLDQLNTFATTSKTSTSKATADQESMHEVSTSMKVASEELNDFINDVIAELREATENL